MDCADCLERLHPYLDRELSPTELAEVRVHLDDCGGCEDEFVVEERFLARVRDCCHEDVAPGALRSRIIARLRMELDAPQ
jgi:mycothiol system anti-sigma-R factor